jgi:hypothetical protein
VGALSGCPPERREPAAGELCAEIDRATVDQAPYVWLVNPIVVEFVAERVSNYQVHLQWGASSIGRGFGSGSLRSTPMPSSTCGLTPVRKASR